MRRCNLGDPEPADTPRPLPRQNRWLARQLHGGGSDDPFMSLPRQVLPGSTYMITRRCTQRQFLMRPDPETNNAFIYCLAEAAARHGIEVLFTVAMSNHHHTGIFDPNGSYPAFVEHFHKMFAKCMNAMRGRGENFWSSDQTSVVRLENASDVLTRMTYALSNPAKDNLVEKAQDWPGVNALEAIIAGKPTEARRPPFFFRAEGEMPAKVTLHFVRPPQLADLPQVDFVRAIEEGVRQIEDIAAQRRRNAGLRVLGPKRVLSQEWTAQPAKNEAHRGDDLFPFRGGWTQVEARLRYKSFRDAYLAARAAFLDGLRDVIFPAGTYWLRRFARVPCAAEPALA
jgi:putative transposase